MKKNFLFGTIGAGIIGVAAGIIIGLSVPSGEVVDGYVRQQREPDVFIWEESRELREMHEYYLEMREQYPEDVNRYAASQRVTGIKFKDEDGPLEDLGAAIAEELNRLGQ